MRQSRVPDEVFDFSSDNVASREPGEVYALHIIAMEL